MVTIATVLDGKHTHLTIDFADENVHLTGETLVVGDEAKALSYAPFFEADLRRNNAELFPTEALEVMNNESD